MLFRSGLELDEDSLEGAELKGRTIILKEDELKKVKITYTAKVKKAGEHTNTVIMSGDNMPEDMEDEATVEGVAGPSTGDSLPILPIAAFVIAGIALIIILIMRRKK